MSISKEAEEKAEILIRKSIMMLSYPEIEACIKDLELNPTPKSQSLILKLKRKKEKKEAQEKKDLQRSRSSELSL